MSHNVKVKDIKVTDLAALEMAVKELAKTGIKISMERNAHYRGYDSSQSGTRDVVIKLPDSKWELAFVKQADGSYIPEFDPYANEVRKALGYSAKELDPKFCDVNGHAAHIGKLMQAYTANVIERQAAWSGKSVRRVGVDPKTKAYNMVVANY